MKVYHAGQLEIREPDVHYGRVNADFGQGFYVTPEEEFACRWAKPSADGQPLINVYELDLEGLKVVRLERTMDWFACIFQNRRSAKDVLDADVVIGPIANDTIFDTMGIITSGYLEDEQALELLQLGPAYTQIVLKTEKAAAQLAWQGVRTLGKDEMAHYQAAREKEEAEYLEVLAAKMESF